MNLNLDPFTYITGIAGLLGLVIQLADAFPKHREARKATVLLIIGVFLGTLISAARSVKIDLPEGSITPFSVLVAVFVVVLALIAITATFTQDKEHRDSLFTFTTLGTVALFVLLFFGAISSSDFGQRSLTVDELIELSTSHVSRGNFDRAISCLQDAQRLLPKKDDRSKGIDAKIKEIKTRQLTPK